MKPRDAEALYHQYHNLIARLIKDEYSRFTYVDGSKTVTDDIRVADLESYIQYQFVKLVKEYDVHSPVDFPGYIKSKLTLRTKHSFVKSYFKHQARELYTETGDDEEEFGHLQDTTNSEPDFSYITEQAIDKIKPTELERKVIYLWSTYSDKDSQVYDLLYKEDNDFTLSKTAFLELTKDLRARLKNNITRVNLSVDTNNTLSLRAVEKSSYSSFITSLILSLLKDAKNEKVAGSQKPLNTEKSQIINRTNTLLKGRLKALGLPYDKAYADQVKRLYHDYH